MAIIDLEMADRENATGVVGLVQAYVNTVDIQDGPEELTGPDTLGAWLVAHGLMESGQAVTDADLKNAIAVREAIRGVIGANTGGRVYPVDVATLNEAATARLAWSRTRKGLPGRWGASSPRCSPRWRTETGPASNCAARSHADGRSTTALATIRAAGAPWPPAATARKPGGFASARRSAAK